MKNKKLWKDIKRSWQLYTFLIIPVALVIIFDYIPMVGVQMAFRDFNFKDGMWGSEWVGFAQFIKFFKSPMCWTIIKNTLILSLYSLIVSFPFPIILALAFNVMKNEKFRNFAQFTLYMPHFISTVVLIGMVLQLLNSRTGMYASIYTMFNGGNYPKDLFASETLFRHIYVWSGVWQSAGWGTIIYTAALAGVDESLHESMQIDGASRLQRVRHLDLPCILPTATILLILNCGSILGVGFEKIFLLQNPLNTNASEVISTYVYKMGIAAMIPNYSYSSAIGLFNSLINFTVLILVNNVSRRVKDGTSLW